MMMLTALLLLLCLPLMPLAAPSIFDEQKGEWISFKQVAKPATLPKQAASWVATDASIFVGIAHYRDGRCAETLKNLFTKAKFPERVHVGIMQHIDTEEDSLNCRKDYCRATGYAMESGKCPHLDNIRQLVASAKDARGPGVSRYMQEQLLQQEQFCLQVDAHSDFSQHWDMEMLDEWAATGNEYALLSTRPPSSEDPAQAEAEVNHVCQTGFTDQGMLRNLSPRRVRGLKSPVLAPLWSGAFSFSKCHAVRKAPHDPNLRFLLDGEEFAHMARLWTRGYDVYSPDRVLVTHDDNFHMRGAPARVSQKNNKPAIENEWASHGQSPEFRRIMYDEALTRAKTLLDMEGGVHADAVSLSTLQEYGLGTKRSLDQFMAFTGVDVRQGALFADACEARQWVPFTPDSHAELDDGDAWGLSAEVAVAGAPDVPILDTGAVETFSPGSGGTGPSGPSAASGASIARQGDVTLSMSVPATVNKENPLKEYTLLWSVFQPIDSIVEAAVASIDGNNGMERSHAVKTLKLLLLLLPAVIALVIVAVATVTGRPASSFFGNSAEEDAGIGPMHLDLAKRV